MTSVAVPPPDQFVRRGACHWCGEKNRRIATVGSIAQGPKTQLCLECAGHPAPGRKNPKTREYQATVTLTVNITASSKEEADQRAEQLGERMTIAWPKAKWAGDEYAVETTAQELEEIRT